ncbi:MAG: hypothetical protein VXW43_19860, partial [Pseudomonadota bacterium]|nr:hypothetical protein [Pseudomonadota bacterium]
MLRVTAEYRHDRLLWVGDFNARLRRRQEGEEQVLGPHILGAQGPQDVAPAPTTQESRADAVDISAFLPLVSACATLPAMRARVVAARALAAAAGAAARAALAALAALRPARHAAFGAADSATRAATLPARRAAALAAAAHAARCRNAPGRLLHHHHHRLAG